MLFNAIKIFIFIYIIKITKNFRRMSRLSSTNLLDEVDDKKMY